MGIQNKFGRFLVHKMKISKIKKKKKTKMKLGKEKEFLILLKMFHTQVFKDKIQTWKAQKF